MSDEPYIDPENPGQGLPPGEVPEGTEPEEGEEDLEQEPVGEEAPAE